MRERESGLPINKNRIREVIELALDARQNNKGIFAKLPEPPEVEFIRQAKALADGSYPLYAVFFLITTLFADNSVRKLKLAADPG